MADNRQDVAYLNDVTDVARVPASAESGNLPVFGANNVLQDSGTKPSDFTTALQTAASALWQAVNGVYAIKAYKATAWLSGAEYAVDDFCQYGGVGYRCTEAHTAGTTFDTDKWTVVLTALGKAAIDALLAGYSKDGLAALLDLAPIRDTVTRYEVGQLAIEDSVLKICTKAGRGGAGAEFSADATVEMSIALRLAALASTYLAGSAVDAPFDTTSKGYAVGDTCSYGAKFYVCKNAVAQGAAWSSDDWTEKTFKAIMASQVVFAPRLFLPDESGKYHELKIVTKSSGTKVLGVDQEGVDP